MAEPSKSKTEPKRKRTSPNALTKGSKKSDIELSEDQLKNVAGGESSDHKHKGDIT